MINDSKLSFQIVGKCIYFQLDRDDFTLDANFVVWDFLGDNVHGVVLINS